MTGAATHCPGEVTMPGDSVFFQGRLSYLPCDNWPESGSYVGNNVVPSGAGLISRASAASLGGMNGPSSCR
ncbi:hypothetical protein NDU88_006232 [Pleurodeles waltl]|uniref:Uncharacterized protein n=1 Tax=Pleurodeles waltl TaxID=8319 RepID=A0AAV7N0C7_PLEWA|nr:hypothetical protein NDU88_006232 [Pleurodeles waltl]